MVLILGIVLVAIYFAVKFLLSLLAFAYPLASVCSWLYGRADPRPVPVIPEPAPYDCPLRQSEVVRLVTARDGWQLSLEEQYATGDRLGLNRTAKSDYQRFDNRRSQGQVLNGNIDACEWNIADSVRRIRVIQSEVLDGFSDYWEYRAAFASWYRRQAFFSANAVALCVFLPAAAACGAASLGSGRLWPKDWQLPFFYEGELGAAMLPVVWGCIAACVAFACVFPISKNRWALQLDASRAEGWDRLLDKWRNPFAMERPDPAGADGDQDSWPGSEDAGGTKPKEGVDTWREILGVTSDASVQEIKEAYREAVKMYHPDRVSGLGRRIREVAEAEMKRINGAYEAARREKGFR